MLTELLRQQIVAVASIPVSSARLLASLADAAELSVQVLRRVDERAAATNRVLHSFEEPLVRLAEAVDASLVDQTVEALGRLPSVVARASALADRADGLIAGLEIPLRALGPLTQAVDVGRLSGLVARIEETLPRAGLLLRSRETEAVEGLSEEQTGRQRGRTRGGTRTGAEQRGAGQRNGKK